MDTRSISKRASLRRLRAERRKKELEANVISTAAVQAPEQKIEAKELVMDNQTVEGTDSAQTVNTALFSILYIYYT